MMPLMRLISEAVKKRKRIRLMKEGRKELWFKMSECEEYEVMREEID